MRYADASALAPIDFLRLVFSSIGAYILFNDISDVWTYVGACVIFLAAWYNTWHARRVEKRKSRDADKLEGTT
jgi:drug/metabolite transporter (DMT)-like permease